MTENNEYLLDNLKYWTGVEIRLKNDEGDLSKIICKISNVSQCCEEFGYYVEELDYKKIVGAKIKKVRINYDHKRYDDNRHSHLSNMVCITIETDKDNFRIILYNEHNGYYEHGISIQIIDKCMLKSI